MTDDKFGNLRAVLAAVAPAPWSAQRSEIRLEWWVHCDRFGPMLTTGYVGNSDARPMAEYLAVSRNTLPMLLSEHDRWKDLATDRASYAVRAIDQMATRRDEQTDRADKLAKKLAKKLKEAEAILAEARKLADMWNECSEPAGESLEQVLEGKIL